ncbi:hypothetical protein MNBD_BACTEROID05-1264 [hydrothermal vent metagenome]|uniref:PilZ domain-containing protein n=1 Tax=hydrothermal vent metagenome TaxID=652676 RepID=A0A3B0TWE4_9ZZZZ
MKKRKVKRIECLVPVEGKEGGLFDQTRVVDFSKGGVGFVSDHEIPVNQEIAIEFDLKEDEEPAFVIGKVRWVTPILGSDKFRIGLIFDDVLRGSKTRLDKYFKKEKNDD